MPQVQIPGSQRQSDEPLEDRNKRGVDQARLDWLVRTSRHLEFRMKWRRFYRENNVAVDSLLLFKDDTEKRIQNIGEMVKNPLFMTGESWTKAAELLEETEAHLEAIQEALSKS